MGLFDGKKGLILGVANDHSLAWAIAQQILAEADRPGSRTCPTALTTNDSATAAACLCSPTPRAAHNIIGIPSETARLCAACISANSRRDSDLNARPRMNFDIAGTAMDVIITNNASTRISSISVKPEPPPHPRAYSQTQIRGWE